MLSIPAGSAFAPRPAPAASEQGVVADIVARRPRAARRTPSPSAWSAPTSSAASSTACRRCCSLLLSRHLGFGDAGYGYVLAGLGVGGILGTTAAGRAARSGRPRAGAGRGAARCSPSRRRSWPSRRGWPGLLLWAVIGGAGAVLVEVLCETALQRELDEEVFARAYGIALPVTIGGIVGGSLVAAPLVALVGLTGAIVGTGVLAGGYAGIAVCPAAPSAATAHRSRR